MQQPELERPSSLPAPGVIGDFDEGWDAHELGLDRQTVEVFVHPSKRDWVLLGYDARVRLSEESARGVAS